LIAINDFWQQQLHSLIFMTWMHFDDSCLVQPSLGTAASKPPIDDVNGPAMMSADTKRAQVLVVE